MNKILYVSPEYWVKLQTELPEEDFNKETFIGGIPVQVLPLLPIDITYDVCDVETRRECKIQSGEKIHYFLMDIPPLVHPGPIGLMSDFFIQEEPRPSIMQMMLLEREARRHFPLADAKSRAAYVSNSLDLIKRIQDETPPTE